MSSFLKGMCLTANKIGEKGCRFMSEALKENSTLIKVNLLGVVKRDYVYV